MTHQAITVGNNRTGIASKKEECRDMERAARDFGPTSDGEAMERAADMRRGYEQESGGLGHVPPSTKKAKKKGKDMLSVLLIDKVGARLAFERTGTRLWRAVVDKLAAVGSFDGGPSRNDVLEIENQEAAHFHMLCDAMHEIGGDPTAVTPSADLESVVGHGIGEALGDPRCNLLQVLESVLVAELADHEQWTRLVEIAREAGESDLVEKFTQALEEEREHLQLVRSWIVAGQQTAAR